MDRIWTKPALAVLAIDATRVADASNTLIPSARAKVSVRVAPGDDAARALGHLLGHLEPARSLGGRRSRSWTAISASRSRSMRADRRTTLPANAFREAWTGTAPVDIGVGGSIPFIAEFAQAFPDAAILVTGVEDPDTRAHGANEGLHLGEFERVCLAEALLLTNLANLT